VVSGLISRTILNSDHIGPQDFHGCVYYDNLKPYDLSRWLIAELMNSVTKEQSSIDLKKDYGITKEEKTKAKEKCRAFMENTKIRFNITDENLIKPGLGEATRVLLRRSPELLILKNINDPDVTHALYLAKEKKVPMEEQKDLPYRACSLIKRLDLP
jgi:hypothetical protein